MGSISFRVTRYSMSLSWPLPSSTSMACQKWPTIAFRLDTVCRNRPQQATPTRSKHSSKCLLASRPCLWNQVLEGSSYFTPNLSWSFRSCLPAFLNAVFMLQWNHCMVCSWQGSVARRSMAVLAILPFTVLVMFYSIQRKQSRMEKQSQSVTGAYNWRQLLAFWKRGHKVLSRNCFQQFRVVIVVGKKAFVCGFF